MTNDPQGEVERGSDPVLNGLNAALPILLALIDKQYNIDTWGLHGRVAAVRAARESALRPSAGADTNAQNMRVSAGAGVQTEALTKVMQIFWVQDAESEAHRYYCGHCEAEDGAERAIWQEVPHRDDCPYAIARSALKEGETDGAESEEIAKAMDFFSWQHIKQMTRGPDYDWFLLDAAIDHGAALARHIAPGQRAAPPPTKKEPE